MVIKPSFIALSTVVLLCLATTCSAQLKRPALVKSKAVNTVARSNEIGQSAVVVDETLSVLREKPSLFSDSVQRMRRGRTIQILGVTEADGVKFYKVTAPPKNYGWVQADAVFGRFRAADEERLARLVQASDGFEQIEIAHEFFNLYPQSKFRSAILLLYGDLLEEAAVKLSKDAGSRLNRKEMAASAAPMHSYFLNFNMLDRYRKLGVIFLFNPATRLFHYDGGSWREIAAKFSTAPEAAEAKNRLESLRVKMSAVSTVKAK